jgi:hypothetical protein
VHYGRAEQIRQARGVALDAAFAAHPGRAPRRFRELPAAARD